jgi:predicted amidohydrolase YtcJ
VIAALAAAAVVITNANVVTVDAKHPHARCVAIQGERITKVGDRDGDCGKSTIDARGATLVPGFNDAHVHFGLNLTLAKATKIPKLPKAEWLDAVRAAAARRPYGAWCIVQTDQLPDGVAHARDLDFIGKPVMVVTRQGALLNTSGKLRAKLDGAVQHGFVPGRYVAAALDMLTWVQRAPHIVDAALRLELLARENGITSLQIITDEMPKLFEYLREKNELTSRVRFVPLAYRFDTILYEPKWKGPAPLWVRVDGIKYFHEDGAQLSRLELKQIVEFAVQKKLHVVMHVLGRYSLRKLLDAIEAGTKADPAAARLFRVDHADDVPPEDARRIAKLGMVVCANPTLIADWKSPHLGPLRTLLDSGVRLCLGSDWIGEGYPRSIAPLENLALAVTHAGYGDTERITGAQALEAATLGSAFGEGMEAEKGSIEIGKLADLVLLSGDPTATDPRSLRVLWTMVGGRVVWRAQQSLR